ADVVERAGDDLETVARLRAADCHEAEVLPNSFRSARLVQQAGVAYRWGYRGEWRTPLLAPAVPRPPWRRRAQVEDYRELLAAMAVPPPASWVPRLVPDDALLARGRERLERGHVAQGEPLLGLFPGAEWGPSKRWPWRHFADLARALRRALPQSGQVIL